MWENLEKIIDKRGVYHHEEVPLFLKERGGRSTGLMGTNIEKQKRADCINSII